MDFLRKGDDVVSAEYSLWTRSIAVGFVVLFFRFLSTLLQ